MKNQRAQHENGKSYKKDITVRCLCKDGTENMRHRTGEEIEAVTKLSSFAPLNCSDFSLGGGLEETLAPS